ncbi:MAG: hypothetical protein ISQ08_02100 [Planctomycetes bacterium]|nr:hypothetical protein [Planctomycetota bacterium]MDA0947801.1 hypothetical protein [Planctomycetota bacterium]
MRRTHRWGRSLVALAAFLASCASERAAVWNLDVLMDDGDRLRHLAPLRSGTDQLASELIPGRAPDSEVAVGDPSLRALEELLVLDGSQPSSLQGELDLIRCLTRYASRCPGRLARERATLALGAHALRLELDRPRRAPANPTPPEAVAAAFGELKSAWLGSAEAAAAFERLPPLVLGLEGAERLLFAYARLVEAPPAAEELVEPLFAEARRVEARAVSLALGAALDDPDPWVRAAAFECGAGVWGAPFVLESLEALEPVRVDAEGRVIVTARFGLAPVRPAEDLVVQRVLELLGRLGSDLFELAPPERRARFRVDVLRLLAGISYDLASYGEATRSAALRTLCIVAPDGPGTRRKEDWEAWWREQAALLQAVGPGAE